MMDEGRARGGERSERRGEEEKERRGEEKGKEIRVGRFRQMKATKKTKVIEDTERER